MRNLMKNILVSVGYTLIAAASNTSQATAIVDMSEYDGVMFITPITADTNTGVATLTGYNNTANSTSGATAITGAVATGTSTGTSLAGGVLIVDIFRPLKRYVYGLIASTVANITFGPTITIRYHAHNKPTTADATVIASATVVGS